MISYRGELSQLALDVGHCLPFINAYTYMRFSNCGVRFPPLNTKITISKGWMLIINSERECQRMYGPELIKNK